MPLKLKRRLCLKRGPVEAVHCAYAQSPPHRLTSSCRAIHLPAPTEAQRRQSPRLRLATQRPPDRRRRGTMSFPGTTSAPGPQTSTTIKCCDKPKSGNRPEAVRPLDEKWTISGHWRSPLKFRSESSGESALGPHLSAHWTTSRHQCPESVRG